MVQPINMRCAPSDMAFCSRGSLFVAAYSYWSDPAHDRSCEAWVHGLREVLEPLKSGYYIGETDLAAGTDRARQCFTAAAWERLRSLKKTHDPEDIFFDYLDSRETRHKGCCAC
jgi:hypothetical protein